MPKYLNSSEYLAYARRVSIEDRDIFVRVSNRMAYPEMFQPSALELRTSNMLHSILIRDANI
jgi:hypothetical protein